MEREESEEVQHVETQTCECADCQNKRKYVQILDVDRYIENLNDWD